MDSTEAGRFLDALFGDIPGADQWTWQAPAAARVADSDGRAPSDTGWVDTVDEWLAAAWVADQMALAGMMTTGPDVLQQVGSEGTTLTVQPGQPVDWARVAAQFRSRSPLTVWGPGMGAIVPGGEQPLTIPRSWVVA